MDLLIDLIPFLKYIFDLDLRLDAWQSRFAALTSLEALIRGCIGMSETKLIIYLVASQS